MVSGITDAARRFVIGHGAVRGEYVRLSESWRSILARRAYPDPVIALMASQRDVKDLGGTMRLGAYSARLLPDSKAAEAYGTTEISERHRHRWEVNNAYRDVLTDHGMRLAGKSPDGSLVEMIELGEHPWFVGCQFHPELKSRPTRPHPLFAAFIGAALARHLTASAASPSVARPAGVAR